MTWPSYPNLEAGVDWIQQHYGISPEQLRTGMKDAFAEMGRLMADLTANAQHTARVWNEAFNTPQMRKAMRQDRTLHQRVQRQLRVRDRRLARRRRRQWARALACPTCHGRGEIVTRAGVYDWDREPCFDCPAAGLRFGYWVHD